MTPAIDNKTISDIITAQYGEKIFSVEESYGMLDFVVAKDIIIDLLSWLKTHEKLNFHFLTSLCGIHFPDEKDHELSVVYHLHSMPNNIRIRIHVFLPLNEAEIPTVTDIFPTANWMERETFDFFGIKFTGHPNLTIILNREDIGYHPMLKQYPLVDDTRTDKNDAYFGR